jgi:hypothetical protein
LIKKTNISNLKGGVNVHLICINKSKLGIEYGVFFGALVLVLHTIFDPNITNKKCSSGNLFLLSG